MAVKEKKYYQCGICGFEYDEKKWAEKCEAWCKEKGSCSEKITAHAVRGRGGNEMSVLQQETVVPNKGGTFLFYGLIGMAASLGFALALYWILRLDSSLGSLVDKTSANPVYLWLYVILTFLAIVLFGINAALFAYRWRRVGPPKIGKHAGGTGLGSLVGIFASACPSCGSVLLAAIGIAGGLSAFPFAGLELKLFSVLLLALPVWLSWRDIKKVVCGKGEECPEAKDASFRASDVPAAYLLAGMVFVLGVGGWNFLKVDPIFTGFAAASTKNNVAAASQNSNNSSGQADNLMVEIADKVLPPEGHQPKIVLGDSTLNLMRTGVISREKFEALYAERGGLPPEFQNIFDEPFNGPVALSQQNAQVYVNLLWGIGLSNYMESNKQSPVNGESLFNFASTGGWILGNEKNGGAYFNKFEIVKLTSEQEALVTRIAQNTYRPCCGNSTFFQDCNHGSALLGLLQLGASQGLSEQELYREAVAFNSFWFPQQYVETALFFKKTKNTDWENVDPVMIMSKDYSSSPGWVTNVHKYLQQNNLLPAPPQGGGGCGA